MSIQEHLNKIRNAIKGSEVRESIAKGIETAYDDASENGNANMEVKIARGTHPNLRSRLDEVDNKQQQTTAQLAHTEYDFNSRLINKASIKYVDEKIVENIRDFTGVRPVIVDSFNDMTDERLLYVHSSNMMIHQFDGENFVNTGIPFNYAEISDHSLEEYKLSSHAIQKLSSSTKQVMTELNSLNRYNLFARMYDGSEGFDVRPTGGVASFSFEPYGDGILDVKHQLRFNYVSGSSYILNVRTFPVTPRRGYKAGMWLRRSDIVNLGDKKVYCGVEQNGQVNRSELLSVDDLLTVGTSQTYEDNGTHTTISVVLEYGGWIYLSLDIHNVGFSSGDFRFGIFTSVAEGSGKLDILNLTLLDTYSFDEILPYHIYPDTFINTNLYLNKREIENKVRRISELERNELVDLKGAIVGDSISAIYDGYDKHIAEAIGCERLVMYSKAGRPMTNGSDNGTGAVEWAKVFDGETIDWSNYDFLILSHGTNDFKLNMPIGNEESVDKNQFYGAYKNLIEYVLGYNPEIQIILTTPLQRDNDGYDVEFENSAGHKLIEYTDAILKIGEKYATPVYDAYRNSQVTKETLDTYTYDGLHLNGYGSRTGNGYKLVGRKIGKFAKQNLVKLD